MMCPAAAVTVTYGRKPTTTKQKHAATIQPKKLTDLPPLQAIPWKDVMPASLEAVRRKVMMIVYTVERETKLFIERCLHVTGEPDNWLQFLTKLCEKLSENVDTPVTLADFTDYKDLDVRLTRLRKSDKESDDISQMESHQEYKQLRRICERGKLFEYIASSLGNELITAYKQLLCRYCISFERLFSYDLPVIHQYEDNIVEWKREIQRAFDVAAQLVDNCHTHESPLKTYLSQQEAVTHFMEETCKALVRVCEPMKRWVVSDAAYASRIQRDVNNLVKQRLEMRDALNHVAFSRDQLQVRQRRLEHQAVRIGGWLTRAREGQRQYKRRAVTLSENRERTEAELTRKRNDLAAVRTKISTRKGNSPTIFNYLSNMAETLRDEIWELEAKLETMHTYMNSLDNDRLVALNQYECLNTELERNTKSYNQTTNTMHKKADAVTHMRAELRELDEKIAALKRLRDIKLNSDTVRKIHNHRYDPADMEDAMKDELEEAFKVTAAEVGKDWTKLYQQLPFQPERGYSDRLRDTEAIDMNSRRLKTSGYRMLSMKSLQKWRRLSRTASVLQLLNSLKAIKRWDTARLVQKAISA